MQDNKAKRSFDKDEFVDEPWINDEIEKCKYNCMFCKKHMELYIDENSNVKSNITVDRKDNSKAHIKSNCQICCLDCNRIKGNRY
jgi:5-methylcytosine-specific restriction endonuclease McrA